MGVGGGGGGFFFQAEDGIRDVRTWLEFRRVLFRSGINIQAKFQGYDRREVSTIGDFATGLQDALLTNVKRMFLEVKVKVYPL